jgi:superfamily II DNA or RNA helicase
MALLTIGNSFSRVSELTLDQEKRLRKALTYTEGGSAAYFSGYGPRRKCLLSKRGEFPTGLMRTVLGELKVDALKVEDTRKIPKISSGASYTLNVTPYQTQLDAVTSAVERGRGTISMPTGTGKSLVIGLIALRLNLKTLVVVPSIEIKKQLIELFKTFKMHSQVTVECISSPKLNNMKNFDCLIIDEAHHAAAKTYQKLNKTAWTGICYRFFLTATPFRNDKEETLLFESIAGQLIYHLSYKEAIKQGLIVPVEAYYIDLPKTETDAYTWAQVYSTLVVKNDYRNNLTAALMLRLNEEGKSALCLVKEVAHGKVLEATSGLPFVHGQDDESRDYIRQFNNGGQRTLIGTTGILGEGVDTKPCEIVIIAGLGKAKSAFMQQVGRAVRKFPGKEAAKIIIFRDRSHKFTLRHFNTQVKILKEEYGVIPQKLDL